MQINKVFKSIISLSSFAVFINKNCSWFALSLLFERVMFSYLDNNSSRDCSRSNEGSDGGKSKVESDVKKKCIYNKDKELL